MKIWKFSMKRFNMLHYAVCVCVCNKHVLKYIMYPLSSRSIDSFYYQLYKQHNSANLFFWACFQSKISSWQQLVQIEGLPDMSVCHLKSSRRFLVTVFKASKGSANDLLSRDHKFIPSHLTLLIVFWMKYQVRVPCVGANCYMLIKTGHKK